MSTEIQPFVGKLPIMMKGGLVHWVTEETWGRVNEALTTQTSHRFMRIAELNITVNTAEMEGAYTMKQYEDWCKVKQGMWQCEYQNWHNKGKRECECRNDFARQEADKKRKKEEDDANRPLTPEEREAQREAMTLSNEKAALKNVAEGKPDGLWAQMYAKKNPRGRTIRRSTVKKWEAEHGPVDVKGLAINEKA